MSNRVKMIMISYNSAINSEVVGVLNKSGVENYTKWTQVYGKGKRSGSHFGDEIWPGENSVIFSAVESEKIDNLLSSINELRSKLGEAGIKAFTWNIEQIT